MSVAKTEIIRMSKILRCACGYQWLAAAIELSPAADRPVLCPCCGALVETLSTRGSGLDPRESETIDSSWPLSPPPETLSHLPAIVGYEIQNELGRGGMGVVYRAFSSKLNRRVALKTLKRIDPVALQRFKQEFRALADVNHRNLVTLYELISDGETWFFSMELIEGVGFLKYVRSGIGDGAGEEPAPVAGEALSPLQMIRLRRGLTQLVVAVAALHKKGVLHRDIKPSNILVTAEERLVLLDFGLAAELGGEKAYQSTDGGLVGTVAYMSPEQGSIDAVTQASDWYSVGVVLYEALTGRVPFCGGPLDVLFEKRQQDPPPPNSLAPSVPEDLNQLCVDLLRRNPADRPDAEEILQRLVPAAAEPSPGGLDSESAAEKVPLVGRDGHLASLESCYRDLEQSQAVLVLVHGNSGMGKSTLLQEFCDRVRRRGAAVVLSGRCYEQESVPFKALDSLIDALCNFLRRLPRAEADALMPRDIQALVRLFPVMGRGEAVHDARRRSLDVQDQQELRRRAVNALREMLGRIGDRRPLVLVVDDLQWGDVDSAVMLCELLKPPDAPLLMFVGAYRAEDAQTSPFLRALRESERRGLQRLNLRELAVEPLTESEARSLAVLLLRRQGDAAAQATTIARESGGSPFFALELARYLHAAAHQPADTVDLETVLRRRLQALPPPALRLLEAVAVAGRPTSQDEILEVAGLPAEGPQLLARLKAEHLIRVTGHDQQPELETYHDRIREAMCGQLEPSARREIHHRLARTIEASLGAGRQGVLELWDADGAARHGQEPALGPQDWQRVFDLAFHYDSAGDRENALFYSLIAAEQASRQHSLQIAVQQYRIAQRGVASRDVATQRRVAEGLGSVLMLEGHYAEAEEALATAKREAAHAPRAVRARIEGKLGELAFKRGDMLAARNAIEDALHFMRRTVPRSQFVLVLCLLFEIGVQVLHTWFPKTFVGRRGLAGADDEFVVIRLYSRLAYVYWFLSGKLRCLWTHLRNLNLTERYAPTSELAQAYAEHGPVISLVPNFPRAYRYVEKSLEIRRELGDVWGQGPLLHYYGIVLYAASQFSRCIEKCQQAIELLDRTGDFWEVNMARYQAAASFYRLGDLQRAQAEAQKMYQSGLELGDVQASGLAVDILSKASSGRVPREVIHAELARPRGSDAQTACQVLQAEGVRLLAEGDFRAAADVFRQGWEIARRAGTKNTYVIPCLPWLATSLRREAERICRTDPAESRRLLRQARKAALHGCRLARKFQNDLPHSLRELGLLSSAVGRDRAARRFFDESLAVAAQQGARDEHEQTARALAELESKRNASP